VPITPPSRLAVAMALAATVAKRSRGAQRIASSMIAVITPPKPVPIRNRPRARPVPLAAWANTRVPASATRASPAAVRRVPKRSKATPIGSWASADASSMVPITAPISEPPSPKVRLSSLEITPPPARCTWAITRSAPATASTRIMAAAD
jgi:hypothetical protein